MLNIFRVRFQAVHKIDSLGSNKHIIEINYVHKNSSTLQQ